MATTQRALVLAIPIIALALAAQTAVRAQTGTMALSAPFFTDPSGDFPRPGSFFDPNGPVPVFLDRPITRAELNRFYRGTLRVPRNRPFTFDPFLGPRSPFLSPDGAFQGQGFFRFPPGFRGQLPSVMPGDNRGLTQVAPGVFYLPGREPGAFGRFQAPLPTPFRR